MQDYVTLSRCLEPDGYVPAERGEVLKLICSLEREIRIVFDYTERHE